MLSFKYMCVAKFRRLTRTISTIALLGLFLIPTSAYSATLVWDLTNDFSYIANPNGVWSFQEGANALPLTSNWSGVTAVQPAYSLQDSGGNFLPAWMKSTTDNPVSNGDPLDVLTGDVFVHSTDNIRGPAGIANVTWTSPINGFIDISGAAWMARDIGRGNTWELYLNGILLSMGSVFSGDIYNRSSPFDFSSGSGGLAALMNLNVSIGDILTLNLIKTTAAGDFTGVRLTISGTTVAPIPLPAALPLFSSAIAGFGFMGWRRRKNVRTKGYLIRLVRWKHARNYTPLCTGSKFRRY